VPTSTHPPAAPPQGTLYFSRGSGKGTFASPVPSPSHHPRRLTDLFTSAGNHARSRKPPASSNPTLHRSRAARKPPTQPRNTACTPPLNRLHYTSAGGNVSLSDGFDHRNRQFAVFAKSSRLIQMFCPRDMDNERNGNDSHTAKARKACSCPFL
jgi:hypothetical protein